MAEATVVYYMNRPKGDIQDDTFEVRKEPMPVPKDGELLVACEYLSLDPASRTWMEEGNPDGSNYMPPVPLGGPMYGYNALRVVESKSAAYKPGDRIVAGLGWKSHGIVHADHVYNRIEEGVDPTQALSVLGFTGLTAYFGVTEVGQVDVSNPEFGKGKIALVSGAAGATGSIAVQLYKMAGFKVIGVAGTDEKCRFVESLGADSCINYRIGAKAFREKLEQLPRIVQYFDNTGGWILNEVLRRMEMFSVIVGCGQISLYNDESHSFAYNLFPIVSHKIRFQGFIVSDYFAKFAEGREKLAALLKAGKLKSEVTVVEGGMEKAPEAIKKLFGGANTGKLVLKC